MQVFNLSTYRTSQPEAQKTSTSNLTVPFVASEIRNRRQRRCPTWKFTLRYLERERKLFIGFVTACGAAVHGSSMGLLSCPAVENEKHLRFNPNKIDGSRETARYGAGLRSVTHVCQLYVCTYIGPPVRSIEYEGEREREKRSHGNQVRELIPLYLTANISLRLWCIAI